MNVRIVSETSSLLEFVQQADRSPTKLLPVLYFLMTEG